jgi:hypothetical protein
MPRKDPVARKAWQDEYRRDIKSGVLDAPPSKEKGIKRVRSEKTPSDFARVTDVWRNDKDKEGVYRVSIHWGLADTYGIKYNVNTFSVQMPGYHRQGDNQIVRPTKIVKGQTDIIRAKIIDAIEAEFSIVLPRKPIKPKKTRKTKEMVAA